MAAQEWEKRGRDKKLKVLYDIKRELSHPFADPCVLAFRFLARCDAG